MGLACSLPQNLPNHGLADPALVFNEFLGVFSVCLSTKQTVEAITGVIEGSDQSLNHETRYLDMTTYKNLSHRQQHVFAYHRGQIYSLFS